MRFQNKRVLITGAGSGIGRAAARLMAQEGAEIAFTYHRNESGAKELEKELIPFGRTILPFRVDMTQDRQIVKLAEWIGERWDSVDILINNAGGLVERMMFFEITKEKWDEIMALNLWSVFLLSQKIGALMKEHGGGVIVNNASVAGRFGGGAGALAYSTAKGALITMTQAMGRELIPHNIRVNALAPGLIDTPFHERFTSPELLQSLLSRVPINRMGTPEEMAKVILFLASEDSSYLVGATIDANGGMWVI